MAKSAIKSKPVKFKLYFSNHEAYIDVFIWKTKKAMHDGAGVDKIPAYLACYATTSPTDVKVLKSGKRIILSDTSLIGELHFYRDYLGVGVVTHELLHVILDLVRQLKMRINFSKIGGKKNKDDAFCEYLCCEIQYLAQKFWQKYYRREERIKNL